MEDQPETSTSTSTENGLYAANPDTKESRPEAHSTSEKADINPMEKASSAIQEQGLEEKVHNESDKPIGETSSERPLPASKVEALKQSETIEREMTNTPRIADEVADSAALLDHPAPEPEALAGVDDKVEDPPSAIPVADIADKAAEADIAAEVADTAEALDAEQVGQMQAAYTPVAKANIKAAWNSRLSIPARVLPR